MTDFASGLRTGITAGATMVAPIPIARPVIMFPPLNISSNKAIGRSPSTCVNNTIRPGFLFTRVYASVYWNQASNGEHRRANYRLEGVPQPRQIQQSSQAKHAMRPKTKTVALRRLDAMADDPLAAIICVGPRAEAI